MGRPKRLVLATVLETTSPPQTLPENHEICKILKGAGNNLFEVGTVTGHTMLVEMPSKFRSTIWIKRGSFVVVNKTALADRSNKLGGEIAYIVRDEKEWRKQHYWPEQFTKQATMSANESDNDDDAEELPPTPTESD